MRERDDLQRDADGFVDMDQFSDEPVDDETEALLRDLMVEAPVPSPPADRFDEWVERAVDEGSEGTDTAALVPDVAPDDDPLAAPEARDTFGQGAEGDAAWSELDAGDDRGDDDAGDPAGPDDF
jgi:hypothetical protein